jgi:hypothetical protein
LRVYEEPEPVGFPNRRLDFTHPAKHKTRWSVYMLSEALTLAGFVPVALRYCDRIGNYVNRDPVDQHQWYTRCPDREVVFDLSYIQRPQSLIVDGVKNDVE